ncbi:MAG: ERAP1-like C-terminal domain-containing protein, partial [Acidobacteriota bacterium]
VVARLSVQGLMNSDARPSTKPIRKPVTSVADLFEDLGLAYGKGEKVLGMMEQWMGPETFMKGIRQYLQDHTWKNATAEDLWSALSKASGLDMEAPLSSFLDQPGLPMVTVDVEPGGVLKMTQRRFLNEGVTAPAETWIFPVRIKYAAGGKTATRTVILDRGTRKLELGADPDWVMPDAGAYGYYRWNIPAPMLVEMARHAADRLSETERVAFLGNASALLDTDALSGDDYLEILNSFAGDAQPDVLSSVVSGLAKVESAFVPDELRRDFARYVRSMLRPLLNRFGFQKRAGENEAVTLFRPRLIKWLGDEGGDGEVRRKALKMARAYLTSPASVDAALADVVLGLAAIDGDEELFKAYRKNFEEAREPAVRGRYLSALGRFADVDLQEKALQYVLEGPVRPNELFQIPRGLGRTEAGEARLFTWLTRHFEALSARIPPQFVASLPFFAGGCSSDRLEAARRFFSDPAHQVQGTGRTLAKLSDQVHDCVRLRKREGPAVEAYLRPRRASGAP